MTSSSKATSSDIYEVFLLDWHLDVLILYVCKPNPNYVEACLMDEVYCVIQLCPGIYVHRWQHTCNQRPLAGYPCSCNYNDPDHTWSWESYLLWNHESVTLIATNYRLYPICQESVRKAFFSWTNWTRHWWLPCMEGSLPQAGGL